MLYYNFQDFDGFKELFGIQHHGNGEKSRKNKILLSYIKNRQLLHEATTSGDYRLLHISSMAELKKTLNNEIMRSGRNDSDLPYRVNIRGDIYRSALYYSDDAKGLCEDGDCRSFRYVSAENERVFKMKMGKLFRKLILETTFGKSLPEQVITYLCEEMAQEWQTHATGYLCNHKLFVNKDFERIYDSEYLDGDFGSCMVDKGYHSFYEDAVDASAAYLESENGKIIARCVIFNKVEDQDGKSWRLAERQYSSGGNEIMKRALIDALINGDHIDGYKRIGAGCGESCTFVDLEENSLGCHKFSIDCNLDWGDTLSYQDSFKNYDKDDGKATNFGDGNLQLDTTDGELKGEDDEDDEREYDDYHECYCDEVTCVNYRGREIYCDSDRLDDFRWVEGVYEYYHEDDVNYCEECEEYYVSDDGYSSDITDDYYCCEDCRDKAEQRYKEENWHHSQYDDEYFENEDEVTVYFKWLPTTRRYESCSISRETLAYKVENGDFHDVDGVVYDAVNKRTRLPYKTRLVRNSLLRNAA